MTLISHNLARRLLFVVAVLGLVVSGYLFVTYITGAPVICGTGLGCDAVRASEYANLFGLPTPFYGLVYYGLLAAGAALLSSWPSVWLRFGLVILTGAGLASSAWFTYLEAFVVLAWCLWCVVSAILTVVAFVLVWGKMTTYDTD